MASAALIGTSCIIALFLIEVHMWNDDDAQVIDDYVPSWGGFYRVGCC